MQNPQVATNLISLVDDDESVRRSTRRLLESLGYRAALFDSAEGFLRFGPLRDTSCLVLDVHMPGMDGLQLQSQLAAAGRRIPIIFMTAYDDQESRRRAMGAGAVAFLGKPFTDQQLLQCIRSASHEFGRELGVAKNLISVIDDDESVRRTTKLLIESFGYRAAVFESAENFLSSGRLDDISCLIVDVQMLGMNGLQLQSQLAAAGRRIPIIFMTGHDNQESRRRALQSGAVAFLGKPFTDQQLLQAIRSALRPDGGGTKSAPS
jgi:FixJ family two-component response regulator